MSLPREFAVRMTDLLGREEAEKLLHAIEGSEAVRAFRINNIKTNIEDFEAAETSLDRKKVDFPPDAYITAEEYPGSASCHHSGAIYMQDISAMSTVFALDIKKGSFILDSCSAPGGKTTQLAYFAGENGIVVANEYDKKRCRSLQGNVERMGARNTVVCNLDTSVLASIYPEMFDLVLCDVPCSGEGMFRKNERAAEEWSVANVIMCAERQREILENVSKCVKHGGKLLYSTCTFSLDENEENVKWFLETHGDFELVEVSDGLRRHTSDGIMLGGCDIDMTKCRRIYPHRSLGEGQFIALLERRGAGAARIPARDTEKRGRSAAAPKKSRGELEALACAEGFIKDNIDIIPKGELVMLGGHIYLAPRIRLPEYNVLSAGVCVGEYQKGRIIPHHQLFSAFGDSFKRKIQLSGSSGIARKYLKGEEICTEGIIRSTDGILNGWAAVLIDGCAVGGAKNSGNTAKNHYPKGLRG